MPKGGSIVQVQQTGAKRPKQKKQGKEGDIAMHLLPGAKVRLISKHKQMEATTHNHGSIRTILRTRLRIGGTRLILP